jgi:hypothetical protein
VIRKTRRMVATLLVAGAFSAVAGSPASAQPVVTGGLVNITIVDAVSLEEVSVQVPVGVAANVCGVNVAVLGEAASDPIDCTAHTTQELPVRFRP